MTSCNFARFHSICYLFIYVFNFHGHYLEGAQRLCFQQIMDLCRVLLQQTDLTKLWQFELSNQISWSNQFG